MMLLIAIAATGALQDQRRAGWTKNVPRIQGAPQFFVAPGGSGTNAGTMDAPWDLESVLSGTLKIPPGAVVWVRGGTYRTKDRKPFQVKLAGREGAPIIVRGFPGERATILDTIVNVQAPAHDHWLWDLELTGSVPAEKRVTNQKGSWPGNLPSGSDLRIDFGRNSKYVNLVIHDNAAGGVGFWVGAIDGEVHGSIIVDNGWQGPDRHHGHCMYTQNNEGTKTISGCIMSAARGTTGGSYTMHAYTEKGFVNRFVVEDNIAFQEGPFLVGSKPSLDTKIRRNYLHGIGLSGKLAGDWEYRDNVVVKGEVKLSNSGKGIDENNVKAEALQRSFLIPNRYDPYRAHVAVYNSTRAASVPVDVSKFLQPGDTYRLLAAKDYYGKPVALGTCSGGTISVPVSGEFGAFILVQGAARSSGFGDQR